MDLQERINLLCFLGEYILENDAEWQDVKQTAYSKNNWFIPNFIDSSATSIAHQFLNREKLEAWVNYYHIDNNISPKNIGIVMAGNIPMVGFHDFLCAFVVGHRQSIKLSTKDDVLLKHLVKKMSEQNVDVENYVFFPNRLKDCDAFIATGSNNTGLYFEQYFGKYPNIIRRNKTSVAIITGNETKEELSKLSEDIHLYFGLGCRNVTKLYVPRNYDFVELLNSFNPYAFFADHHKYKNNYDYQLSIALLNNCFYMTNGSTLLIESEELYSPISVLHYSFYDKIEDVEKALSSNESVQCVIGDGKINFGDSQNPKLFQYADGVDVPVFLLGL